MDSNLWKINGENASESAIGVNLVYNSQTPDTLGFTVDGEPFDSADLYSYGDVLSFYKGEERWFQGVVLCGPRFGNSAEESHQYAMEGLWWYLEQCPFEQGWEAGYSADHVILGKNEDDDYISAGDVIKEVLDHAIGLGAPFTYDASELAVLSAVPPTDEQTSLVHGQAIRKMLQYYPDVTTWFDYTADTPVLHFTRRAAATAVQLNCIDGDMAEEISIKKRSDQVKSGVILNYEWIETIDGERIPTLEQDIYPPGTTTGFDTASFTVQMQGSQLSRQSVDVEVKTFATYGEVVKYFRADLKEKVLTTEALHEPDLPGVVVNGVVPEWSGKQAVEDYYEFVVEYEDKDGSAKKEDMTIKVMSTDAESKTYTKEISYTTEELVPNGLAQAIYEAKSVAHFEGSFQTVEEECTGAIHPGKVLNLLGSRSEWQSMRAAIQSVSYDIDYGRTLITFGPPEHLGPQDAITLLNANRTRITLYSGDSRSTGKTSGDELDTGGGTANSTAASTPRYSKQVISLVGEDEEVRTITLDPAAIGANKTLVGAADGKSMTIDGLRFTV